MSLGRTSRNSLIAVGIYAGLILAFTLVSLRVAVPPSEVGHLRTLDTIPSHLALLAVGGVLLGLAAAAVHRHVDLRLMVLIPTFVVLTDLDHLPSALDISQPVRPAHSFFFALAVFVLIAAATKDYGLSFAALAGFFGHIGVDTGEFAFFSPVSYQDYYTNPDYQVAFIAVALACTFVAGYFLKRS